MKIVCLLILLASLTCTAQAQEDTKGSAKWEYSINCQFSHLETTADGLARAANNMNMWGFVNSKGEWIIKPVFVSCTNFDKNNLSKVSVNVRGVGIRYGFINRYGKMVIPAQYLSLSGFHGGYAVAQDRNGKFGVIDLKGTWVIKPTFDELSGFQHEMAKATKNNKVGLIDLSGEWIVPPIFEALRIQSKSSALVKKNGLWGAIRLNRVYK